MKTLKLFCLIAVISISSITKSNAQGVKYLTDDTLSFIFKSDIFRYITGTAHLGVEIPFKNNRYSVYAAIMGTYYTVANSNADKEQLSGPGVELQFRDYLGKYTGPTKYPFYFGLQFMGRHIEDIMGYDQHTQYNYDPYTYQSTSVVIPAYETQRTMNIYYGGIVLGYQTFVRQAVSFDFFVGGGLRLTYYGGEKSPTKFKKMNEFDYSGIMPKAGVIIGILQR